MYSVSTDSARPALSPLPVISASPPIPIDRESNLFLVGALPGLLRDAPGQLLAAARRHPGQLFALRVGPMSIPIITPPALVQQVLCEDVRIFGKGGLWKSVRRFLGNGLVTSEGDFWLRQRRLLQPLFNARHLMDLGDKMIAAIDIEAEALRPLIGSGDPVEMGARMSLFTQRVLMSALFSSSFSDAEATRLGVHIATAMEQLTKRMFLSFIPEWLPLPGDRAYHHAIKEMDEALLGLVRKRRAAPESTEHAEDLLSRLLAAQDADTGERMSDQQIRDELITLFVAGQDTTAGTLAWLFHLLDQHPAIAARLRNEADEVLGDRPATVADLPRLGYMKQVIQEVMRLYPAGFLLPRFTNRATRLGGYDIAANTPVILSPYLTHRDPTVWERPDEFDPERFTATAMADRHRYAYFPFGGGGRQCIGNHFAMMEAQLILARLIRMVRPRLCPDQVIVPAMLGTLKPRNGLRMTLDPA
jgi:cytochrome P450